MSAYDQKYIYEKQSKKNDSIEKELNILLTHGDISWVGTCLRYRDYDSLEAHWNILDFSKIWLPATGSYPLPSALIQHNELIRSTLAMLNRRAWSSKGYLKHGSLERELSVFRHLMDFLFQRGIYRLSDVQQLDLRELSQLLAKGGWGLALNLEERWSDAIDELTDADLIKSVSFISGKTPRVSRLSTEFWSKRLGLRGISGSLTAGAPSLAYIKLDKRLKDFGYKVLPQFKTQGLKSNTRPVTAHSMESTFISINRLYDLPLNIDQIKFWPYTKPSGLADKLSNAKRGRTKNLSVEDAATLMGVALDWIYNYFPLITQILSDINQYWPLSVKNSTNQPAMIRKFLANNISIQKLNKKLDLPIIRLKNSHDSPKNELAFASVIGTLIGACFIVIAVMNARRVNEILHPKKGLQFNSLKIIDKSLGLFEVSFYIEKTLQDRSVFYVNQSTVDAIEVLSKLKTLLSFNDDDTSLFRMGSWTAKGGLSKLICFTEKRRKITSHYSLGTFLRTALGQQGTDIDLRSHMFRRFFALIYYYQYEHPDLRALSTHLVHFSITMTRTYLTEPEMLDARMEHERLTNKIHLRNDEAIITRRAALKNNNDELLTELDIVAKEKFHDTIDEILSGDKTAGGFSRFVRRLYQKMNRNIKFKEQPKLKKIQGISMHLDERGYHAETMKHGQCNVGKAKNFRFAKCQEEGAVNRGHARAEVCGSCMFHSINIQHLENLVSDLADLDVQKLDFTLTPLQHAQANQQYNNLKRIIELTKERMNVNQKKIQKLISED